MLFQAVVKDFVRLAWIKISLQWLKDEYYSFMKYLKHEQELNRNVLSACINLKNARVMTWLEKKI